MAIDREEEMMRLIIAIKFNLSPIINVFLYSELLPVLLYEYASNPLNIALCVGSTLLFTHCRHISNATPMQSIAINVAIKPKVDRRWDELGNVSRAVPVR